MKLYKKDKTGSIRVWEGWVEDDIVHTRYGIQDGEMIESYKQVKGKNIGRSNETSAEEQALLVLKSMITRQIETKGYSESITRASTESSIAPMLAVSRDKRKKPLTFPVDAQPKLDGVRCVAFLEKGYIRLMSRGRKTYYLKHIQDALIPFFKEHPNLCLDGEIYIHGESLQMINSLVKRYQPNTEKLEYYVYDAFNPLIDEPWSKRKEYLKLLPYSPVITPVSSFEVLSEEDIDNAEYYFVNYNFEGAIIRTMEGIYRKGFRSMDLLKVKSFTDAEFKIVGFHSGEGKFTDCVIWECVTSEGKPFDAVPEGTLEQKKEWYRNGYKYIGKYLTVKYFNYTPAGVPFHPVGKTIRLEEDLDESMV